MEVVNDKHELDSLYKVLNTLSKEIYEYNKLSGKRTRISEYGANHNLPSNWALKELINEFKYELNNLVVVDLDDLEDEYKLEIDMEFEGLEGIQLTEDEIIELNFIRVAKYDEKLYNETVKKLKLKYNGEKGTREN